MVLTSVYTWAKSLDNKSAASGIGNDLAGWQGFLNNHDVKRDRGRSEFEVDHRLVSSFLYELPLGRGRRYFNQQSRIANALVSGWQVNGIVTLQRGFPYSVNARDIGGVLDSFGTNRADVVANPYPAGFRRTIDKWFNTAAFVQPVSGFVRKLRPRDFAGRGDQQLGHGLVQEHHSSRATTHAVPAGIVQCVQSRPVECSGA